MALNVGSPDLSRAGRIKRIIEYKVRGYSEDSIVEALKSEGFKQVSKRTVDRLYNSVSDEEKKAFVDELQRHQLLDISAAPIELRLKYRDRMLDKFLPPRPVPVDIVSAPNLIVTFDEGMRDNGSGDEKTPPG